MFLSGTDHHSIETLRVPSYGPLLGGVARIFGLWHKFGPYGTTIFVPLYLFINMWANELVAYPSNSTYGGPPGGGRLTYGNAGGLTSSSSRKRKFDSVGGGAQSGMSNLQRKSVKARVLNGLRRASRTMLAKKHRKGKQIPISAGESKSFFTKLNRKNGNFKGYRMLGISPSTVIRNGATRTGSTIGVQNAVLLGSYFDASDLTNTFVSAIGFSSGATQGAKIFFKGINSHAMIQNQHNANAHITIYDVMARNDGGPNNVDPVTVFKAGFADAGGGSAANYAVIPATPFANPRFTECYKILQVTPITLSPGSTHNHYINYQVNRLISRERYETNGSSGPLGNLTIYSFMVFHGVPENDVTTKTQVSIGEADLDVVIAEQLTFQATQYTYYNNSITNSLLTAFTVGGSTMNDDGVVQTDAVA